MLSHRLKASVWLGGRKGLTLESESSAACSCLSAPAPVGELLTFVPWLLVCEDNGAH